MESLGLAVDFHTIGAEELADILRKFYAEAAPQVSEKRVNALSEPLAQEYHKNTLKNLRSGINRYLKNVDRDLDIVRDKIFRKANEVLDGKIKQNLRDGVSRPTKHKDVITNNDLSKISAYLSGDNPVTLRYKVWYDISLHFVTRGLEFHEQLSTNSFEFKSDEEREYATLTHETKEKNWQGGLDGKENYTDKRMYATGTEQCPVRSLKSLLAKTASNATSLFNQCSKRAMVFPESEDIWYTDKPVKHYSFTRFMGDISRNSKCSKSYTAHCLRATAIQGMNDAGFELRHIMYMSGHRNEASVRSYNRTCSESQKKKISETLTSISSGNAPQLSVMPHSRDVAAQSLSALPSAHANSAVPLIPHVPANNSVVSAPVSLNSSNFMSAGFMSNSSFTNCTFNFSNNQ